MSREEDISGGCWEGRRGQGDVLVGSWRKASAFPRGDEFGEVVAVSDFSGSIIPLLPGHLCGDFWMLPF